MPSRSLGVIPVTPFLSGFRGGCLLHQKKRHQQVNLVTGPGNPVVTCRVNNKYAFVELRSSEECTKALNLNGIPFMGQVRHTRVYRRYAQCVQLSWLSHVHCSWCVGTYRHTLAGLCCVLHLLGCPRRTRRALRCPSQIRARNNPMFLPSCWAGLTVSQMLKIGRPSKYQGPITPASTWQRLTGQESADNVVDPATKVYRWVTGMPSTG